jgi:hypothetical protein
MAVGDQYQQISPQDRWIFDAAGNVAGVQTPHALGGEGRMLTAAQAALVAALVGGSGVSGFTYDGSNRVITYTRNGIAHSIAYPNSTTAIITSAQGYQRTVTFDGSGRVTGII